MPQQPSLACSAWFFLAYVATAKRLRDCCGPAACIDRCSRRPAGHRRGRTRLSSRRSGRRLRCSELAHEDVHQAFEPSSVTSRQTLHQKALPTGSRQQMQHPTEVQDAPSTQHETSVTVPRGCHCNQIRLFRMLQCMPLSSATGATAAHCRTDGACTAVFHSICAVASACGS